jgi:ribonuclease P/MRP protein subunit RPP40
VKVELILPKKLYEVIENDIESRFPMPAFSRVILPLQALLEDDFFNEYIKKGTRSSNILCFSNLVMVGNILMLSEGKHGVNNVYSLRDGERARLPHSWINLMNQRNFKIDS